MAGALAHAALSAVSFVTSLPPAQRIISYNANRRLPNMLPDFADCVEAWLVGEMEFEDVRQIAACHGVSIPPFQERCYTLTTHNVQGQAHINMDYLTHPTEAWEQVIRMKGYVPSIEETNDLYNRQVISKELWDYLQDRNVNWERPLADAWKKLRFEIPGPQDLIRFAVREAYNPELIVQFGYHHEVPIQVLPWMDKQGFGGDTGIQIPAGGTDGDGRPRVGQATWFDLNWWSHWELPSLTDGYNMLHKLYPDSRYGRSPLADDNSTFDRPKLEMLQKAQDIPDYWRQRLQRISYNPIDKVDARSMYYKGTITKEDFYHIVRQHGQDDNYAQKLVENTYDLISMTDAKVLYYKGEITEDEFKKLIRAHGHREEDIPKLVANAHRLLGQSEVEFMYENFLIKEDRLRDNLQYQGYKPDDIELLVQSSKLRQQRNLGVDPGKANLGYVCTYYKLGLLTDIDAENMLAEIGYDVRDTRAFLDKCKLELKGDTIQGLVAILEQAYYRGLFSDEQMRVELARLTLNPEVTNQWLYQWNYHRLVRYKPAAARQNLTAFKNGIISEITLTARLQNLDFDPASINVMVANTKYQMAQAQSNAINKQVKQLARDRKAAEALALKEQKKKLTKDKSDAKIVTNKANKRLREFIKASSDKNIKDWFKDKAIALWEVFYRLFAKGYTIDDARRWVNHNMPDLQEGEYHAATEKATDQWRREGNYLE